MKKIILGLLLCASYQINTNNAEKEKLENLIAEKASEIINQEIENLKSCIEDNTKNPRDRAACVKNLNTFLLLAATPEKKIWQDNIDDLKPFLYECNFGEITNFYALHPVFAKALINKFKDFKETV